MFPEKGGSSYISNQRTYTSCSNKGFDSCFVWTTLRDPEQRVPDFWKLPCLEAAFFYNSRSRCVAKKTMEVPVTAGAGPMGHHVGELDAARASLSIKFP